jgi:hypothetical protein
VVLVWPPLAPPPPLPTALDEVLDVAPPLEVAAPLPGLSVLAAVLGCPPESFEPVDAPAAPSVDSFFDPQEGVASSTLTSGNQPVFIAPRASHTTR